MLFQRQQKEIEQLKLTVADQDTAIKKLEDQKKKCIIYNKVVILVCKLIGLIK